MRAPRLPALITLVLLLAGCAGTEEPSEGAAPTAATSGAPSEEPTPPPSEEPSAPTSEELSAPPSEEAVSPDEVPGAVTVDAEGTVAEVVAGITGRIEEGPPMLVTTVDHAANAGGAGLDLPATTLLVFGAPPVGTPLMQSQRTVGIDLPQKLLVWDDGGQTRVTWNTAEYLAARHGLEGVDEQLGMIEMLLPMLATGG